MVVWTDRRVVRDRARSRGLDLGARGIAGYLIPMHRALLAVGTLILTSCGATAPRWEARCVIARGCPSATTPPPCDGAADVVLALHAAYAQRGELADRVVTVEGALTRVGELCTLLECAPGTCCNRCSGQLALTGEPRPRLVHPRSPHLVLGDERGPLACDGDDSGQCCPYRVDERTVRVTGTIVEDPRASDGYGLITRSICTVTE